MSQTATMIIGIVIILLLAALLVFLMYWRGLSNAVFIFCFKRGSEERWMRECSNTKDKRLFKMWEEGMAWAKENAECRCDLETVSDKETIAAQYFDFGAEKAVIIVPGMFETSTYSYYFADIYKKKGYNCLLVDNRATGRSGGEYNSLGFNESYDVIKWAELLYKKYGAKRILIHGISMGAVTGLLALNFPDCPAYMSGIVCDEAYYRFEDFFRNYMISKKYNTFVFKTVMKKITRITGTNPYKVTPASFIDRIDVPVLFLAGESDTLVGREQTQEMYDKCGSYCGNKAKELVWFKDGDHGFIRLYDSEGYDKTIAGFIEKYMS